MSDNSSRAFCSSANGLVRNSQRRSVVVISYSHSLLSLAHWRAFQARWCVPPTKFPCVSFATSERRTLDRINKTAERCKNPTGWPREGYHSTDRPPFNSRRRSSSSRTPPTCRQIPGERWRGLRASFPATSPAIADARADARAFKGGVNEHPRGASCYCVGLGIKLDAGSRCAVCQAPAPSARNLTKSAAAVSLLPFAVMAAS